MFLVTGGAGFLGEEIIKKLLSEGKKVRSFDLNSPNISHENLEVVIGDVRDSNLVNKIFERVDVVHHNIAQVPLAKNKKLFWSVNYQGTKKLLKSALINNVNHFVYTSSSAIYGVPDMNPVNESTKIIPAEDYGKAKYSGEQLCNEYRSKGLNCSIIRPRTILGEGRLGIFQILFEWIYQDLNIPVIDNGDNIYQFIHVKDLARATIDIGNMENGNTYNLGAEKYGSMRESIQYVIDNVGSKSKIKSVASNYIEPLMKIAGSVGLSPLGTYHALMYGKNFYFDNSLAKKEINYCPQYSNNMMFLESYNWYSKNRDIIFKKNINGSLHQSPIKQKLLRIVPYLI